jgi:hypothetical protein
MDRYHQNYNTPAMPPGAPAWITPDLLADTLETWQPYYIGQLTVMDSLEILLSVSRLIDALNHQAAIPESYS